MSNDEQKAKALRANLLRQQKQQTKHVSSDMKEEIAKEFSELKQKIDAINREK